MRKLLFALCATAVVFIVLRWQSVPLITDLTPFGIIALEFCDNLVRLDTIFSAWNLEHARRVIYIDFALILCFTFVFYQSALIIHHKLRHQPLSDFTRWAIHFCFVPPVLDILENTGMLITLSGARVPLILELTAWIAAFKFASAAIVVLYLLVSLLCIYVQSKKTVPGQEKYTGRT